MARVLSLLCCHASERLGELRPWTPGYTGWGHSTPPNERYPFLEVCKQPLQGKKTAPKKTSSEKMSALGSELTSGKKPPLKNDCFCVGVCTAFVVTNSSRRTSTLTVPSTEEHWGRQKSRPKDGSRHAAEQGERHHCKNKEAGQKDW